MPPTRRSRTSGGPTASHKMSTSTSSAQQKPLAFPTRVTKPSSSSSSIGSGKDGHKKRTSTSPTSNPRVDPSVVDVDVDVDLDDDAKPTNVDHTNINDNNNDHEPTTTATTRSDEETRALAIPEAQVRRYWKARQDERLAARVHQDELSLEEKVLRLWDVSSAYGPCIGITRLKRWQRAHRLGLNPPIEVLAVLLKGQDSGDKQLPASASASASASARSSTTMFGKKKASTSTASQAASKKTKGVAAAASGPAGVSERAYIDELMTAKIGGMGDV